MKLQQLPRCHAVASMKKDFCSRAFSNESRKIFKLNQCDRSFMMQLLDRRWALINPDSKVHQITLFELEKQHGEGSSSGLCFSNTAQLPFDLDTMENNKKQYRSFYVVRDDLLHPLVNGNKARKLDGLLPLVEDYMMTDVVTCGGCQSAHAAAVAVSCAERGLRSHLLLRGEQPDIPTGYNLISTMFGNTKYIPRSLYAKREEMLTSHAKLIAGSTGCVIQLSDILSTSFSDHRSEEVDFMNMDANGSGITMSRAGNRQRKVVIVNEGAGDAAALLGLIRLVKYLSQDHLFGKEQPINIVVDSGTGTTAVGLGIGAVCLGLPWEITAVMLADDIEGYRKQEKRLISDFKMLYGFDSNGHTFSGVGDSIVNWVERIHPRKFGNVLKGEIESCQQIAQQTGILLDPIYTLAAWEHAVHHCQREANEDAKVVMLHTGGTLGMFGVVQRYKSFFHTTDGETPIKM